MQHFDPPGSQRPAQFGHERFLVVAERLHPGPEVNEHLRAAPQRGPGKQGHRAERAPTCDHGDRASQIGRPGTSVASAANMIPTIHRGWNKGATARAPGASPGGGAPSASTSSSHRSPSAALPPSASGMSWDGTTSPLSVPGRRVIGRVPGGGGIPGGFRRWHHRFGWPGGLRGRGAQAQQHRDVPRALRIVRRQLRDGRDQVRMGDERAAARIPSGRDRLPGRGHTRDSVALRLSSVMRTI